MTAALGRGRDAATPSRLLRMEVVLQGAPCCAPLSIRQERGLMTEKQKQISNPCGMLFGSSQMSSMVVGGLRLRLLRTTHTQGPVCPIVL